MGKINSRSKGVRGEMEIRDIYQQNLGLTFKRDIEQYRAGDHGDLICVDMDFPFVTEVKLYAAGYCARPDWWDQVCKAAKSANKLPLLVYRFDRQQWRWRFPLEAIASLRDYIPAPGDVRYDWRYASECDTDTAMMIIREIISDEQA